MATGRISKRSIDAARPGKTDWVLWDDRLAGFGLKVTPVGTKVFVYQYRLGGRGAPVRRYTIGKVGKLTADGARKVADGLALKVAQGIDPQREKIETARVALDLAFDAYVDRFHTSCLLKEWPATHKYILSLLTTHAVPVLGRKPLPDITRKDIRAVLAPVLDMTATASNLYGVIRRLFTWAVEQDDLERSPIEGMKPPPLPSPRDRVLTDDELALVWRAAAGLGYPFGPVVQMLILTGARRDEVSALGWQELDRETATWTLPAERSKNGRDCINPLSPAAVDLLDALASRTKPQGRWPRQGFVFSTTGTSPVSGFSKAKSRLDKAMVALADPDAQRGPWRLHDLRRTLATGLQRLGVRLEVTEAVLNHVSGSRSGIVGIYQRHDWKDEQRAALEAWAAYVERLLTGADSNNVVELGARA